MRTLISFLKANKPSKHHLFNHLINEQIFIKDFYHMLAPTSSKYTSAYNLPLRTDCLVGDEKYLNLYMSNYFLVCQWNFDIYLTDFCGSDEDHAQHTCRESIG